MLSTCIAFKQSLIIEVMETSIHYLSFRHFEFIYGKYLWPGRVFIYNKILFCSVPGFIAIFILLSSDNDNNSNAVVVVVAALQHPYCNAAICIPRTTPDRLNSDILSPVIYIYIPRNRGDTWRNIINDSDVVKTKVLVSIMHSLCFLSIVSYSFEINSHSK